MTINIVNAGRQFYGVFECDCTKIVATAQSYEYGVTKQSSNYPGVMIYNIDNEIIAPNQTIKHIRFMLNSGYTFPVGTVFRIYGMRA